MSFFDRGLVMSSLALLAACASRATVTADQSRRYGDYEAPRHEVLLADGAFELRRYAPTLVAATFVEGDDFDKASSTGFRRIAKYIFGGNEGARSVAMTVPVTAEAARPVTEGAAIAMTVPVAVAQEKKGFRVTFVMPSSYTRETLPAPKDPLVTIEEVPSTTRAVVQFSWLTTHERLGDKTAALRAWARGRGLELVGEPVVARYNDPFTLPWNRLNEVWFEVRQDAPTP
jgi:hypothetical protein